MKCKEVYWATLKYYPGISLRKTTKTLVRNVELHNFYALPNISQ
jgi:hypothetical protein